MIEQVRHQHSGDDELWSITTYYNPVGYRRRLTNYHVFRRHLSVPLLTVELAFDRDFELREGDADILVQLRARDVMWQKERLLNIALGHLPTKCEKIVWLDCDLVYMTNDWSSEMVRLLDEYPLVQGCRYIYHMTRDAAPEQVLPGGEAQRLGSLMYRLTEGITKLDELDGMRNVPAGVVGCGYVWGGRRSLLERYGFFDTNIVGGGDSALFFAAVGRFDRIIAAHSFGESRARGYLDWAKPFFSVVAGHVGFVEADIVHLCHGSLGDRQYRERHQRLAGFDFDPAADIALDVNGCWRWNSDKPEMHGWVQSFFESRREDG